MTIYLHNIIVYGSQEYLNACACTDVHTGVQVPVNNVMQIGDWPVKVIHFSGL